MMEACLSCLGLGRPRRGSYTSDSHASLLYGDRAHNGGHAYGGYGTLSGDHQPFARDPNLYYDQATRQPDPEQLQREVKELEKICNVAAETLVDVSQGRSSLQMHVLSGSPPLDADQAGASSVTNATASSHDLNSFVVGTAGSAMSRYSQRSVGSIARLPRSYAPLFAEAFPPSEETLANGTTDAIDAESTNAGVQPSEVQGVEDDNTVSQVEAQGNGSSDQQENEAQWLKRVALKEDDSSLGDWNRVNNYTGGLTFILEDSSELSQEDGIS